MLFPVLVSRQFVDMSRIRIEGLLAAFPKLIGTGKQHTYVEMENVRYVYQPMEALYLLLVTNKHSNILEDLTTLRLLSKLVSCFYALCLMYYVINSISFQLLGFVFNSVRLAGLNLDFVLCLCLLTLLSFWFFRVLTIQSFYVGFS